MTYLLRPLLNLDLLQDRLNVVFFPAKYYEQGKSLVARREKQLELAESTLL